MITITINIIMQIQTLLSTLIILALLLQGKVITQVQILLSPLLIRNKRQHHQVLNNNTVNTIGKFHVIGIIRHVANIVLTLPYSNPLTSDNTGDIDNVMTFHPK